MMIEKINKNNLDFIKETDVKYIINEYGLFNFIDELIIQLEKYYLLLSTEKIQRIRRTGFIKNKIDCCEVMSCRQVNEACCYKVVSFTKNNNTLGLPSVMSNTILCDDKTGEVISNISSAFLTYLRTGAVTALATKHIFRKQMNNIGFIGAGCIAQLTAVAFSRIKSSIHQIYVWDTDVSASEIFKERIESLCQIDVVIENPKLFVKNVDIINTSTYGDEIILKKEWLSNKNLHINALGADTKGKQEIDTEILKDSLIITDYQEQAIEEGEINIPVSNGILDADSVYCELVDLINNSKILPNDKLISIFDSTGEALQDLAVINLFLSICNQYNLTHTTCEHNVHHKDQLNYFIGTK